MTAFLDKLNLRPQERRLVVFVGLLVFVALNVLFVVPQFGKVDFWENRKKGSDDKLKLYQKELGEMEKNKALLKRLESEGGVVDMGTDDAVLSLQRDVSALASMSGITPDGSTPVQRSGRTNSFFEEAALRLSASAGEKELVEFLHNLGSRNALVRVRNMSLQPDVSQTKLKANIELVKSFPKKSGGKSSGATSKTAAATSLSPKTTTPAAAPAAVKAVATNAPSTNWFKRLVSRLTPGSGSSSAAKTNAAAAPAAKTPGSNVKFTPRTNAAPKVPSLPAPK